VKALQIEAPGVARLVEKERPRPGEGEVLVRVRRVGFCGSDLSTYLGRNPLVSYPRIPGHEVAATVEEVGPGVGGELAPGLDVVVVPYTACGACSACRWGRPNACQSNQTLGVQRDGAMAEFVVVASDKLIPVVGLGLDQMVLVEPLSVGYHAVRRAGVTSGETVVVLGCGAVGLGAVAAARATQAKVVAVDIDEQKLELARLLGAEVCLDGRREGWEQELVEVTEGLGPQVVIEAVGSPHTFRRAVELVGYGGRVVYIGYSKEPVTYETRLFVQKELDILGSRNALPGDFQGVIRMLAEGKVPWERLVTLRCSLEEAPEALRRWADNPQKFNKIVVEIDASPGRF